MAPTESVHGDFRPGYTWKCSWCDGLSLIVIEDHVVDCPSCAEVAKNGYALEVVRRKVSPVANRVASPAVHAQALYELWQHVPSEGKARCLFTSDSCSEVYAHKWGLQGLETS